MAYKIDLKSVLVGFILGTALLYTMISINKNCWLRSDSQALLDNIIKTLVRQTARWSSAALQDKSPLIAVLHANYGAGYLWALKDIATSEQIKQATNVDQLEFEKKITDIQDKVTKDAIKQCADFNPTTSALFVHIGWRILNIQKYIFI